MRLAAFTPARCATMNQFSTWSQASVLWLAERAGAHSGRSYPRPRAGHLPSPRPPGVQVPFATQTPHCSLPLSESPVALSPWVPGVPPFVSAHKGLSLSAPRGPGAGSGQDRRGVRPRGCSGCGIPFAEAAGTGRRETGRATAGFWGSLPQTRGTSLAPNPGQRASGESPGSLRPLPRHLVSQPAPPVLRCGSFFLTYSHISPANLRFHKSSK